MSVNWRECFKQYVNLVGDYEGTTFLYECDWGTEEWEAIKEIREELLREYLDEI